MLWHLRVARIIVRAHARVFVLIVAPAIARESVRVVVWATVLLLVKRNVVRDAVADVQVDALHLVLDLV
jgi:hypothetical protein